MRLIVRSQIIAIMTLILLLSLPYLSVTATTSRAGMKVEEPNIPGARPAPVHFYTRQNKELTPEEANEDATDSIALCPNGFVADGVGRIGIGKRLGIGHVSWLDVGEWSTIKVNKPLDSMGTVLFRIWFSFSGSGTRTGEFNFFFKRNDENIAEVKNMNFQFTEGMQPTVMEYNAALINQTPFDAGDVFKLYIQCQNNFDGGQILFGSRTHATSIVMECNPIEIVEIKTDKDCIKVIYNEVFKVNPNSMTYVAKVDNIIVSAIPDLQTETIKEMNYRTVRWKTNVKPGTHNIEISISYIANDNSTFVTLTKQFTIKKEPEPNFLGIPLWIVHTIVALVAIVIIVGVGLKLRSHYDEKRWLELEAAGFE